MPSPRSPYKNGTERSRSFNGRGALVNVTDELKRPRTVPDLRPGVTSIGSDGARILSTNNNNNKRVLTKVLMNVNIQGSVGAVQVLISLENNVGELINVVIKQYIKEARRPIILINDVLHFDLHYSQFTLESLDREEKLATLGSRNFFMCKRRADVSTDTINNGVTSDGSTTSSCSRQAEKVTKFGSPSPWVQFYEFLIPKR